MTVRDLNLRIPAGECYGLLGPNGVGGTTIVKIISMLLESITGAQLACSSDGNLGVDRRQDLDPPRHGRKSPSRGSSGVETPAEPRGTSEGTINPIRSDVTRPPIILPNY